jgi:hypothetical protein
MRSFRRQRPSLERSDAALATRAKGLDMASFEATSHRNLFDTDLLALDFQPEIRQSMIASVLERHSQLQRALLPSCDLS